MSVLVIDARWWFSCLYRRHSWTSDLDLCMEDTAGPQTWTSVWKTQLDLRPGPLYGRHSWTSDLDLSVEGMNR
ncbi:unnamed protein product [Boreogadus saida]